MTDEPALSFEGSTYQVDPGETVLQCLERNGVVVPSFCRAGACQSCVLKAVAGKPTAKAQAGLRDSWKRQGLFLSCVCEVTEVLQVARSNVVGSYEARIVEVERLSANVARVLVSKPVGFEFEAGQFVQLQRPSDGVSRPYSIASLPSDPYLEFHVQVMPEGKLSPWLVTAVGEALGVQGPFGECTYVGEELDRPLVLAGTGTGLAPLLGVVRAAAAARHRGPLFLYHGARTASELYYWTQLSSLARDFESLQVVGVCLDGAQAAQTHTRASIVGGDLVATVLARHVKPAEQRNYLCGHPTLVQTLKKKLYLAGATLARIHSDPFLPPAGGTIAD